MTKKRILAFVAAAAITVTAVPLAFAGRGERMHGRGGDHAAIFGILQHVKSELEITDAQQAQLQAIAKGVREQNQQYRQSMRGEMKDVAQLLIENPDDIARAEALLDAQEANRRELRANVLRGVSQALNVLTPEQRAELATLLERHGKRAAKF